MDEIGRKEPHKHRILMETSSSSSPLVSHMPSNDAWKWHKTNFSLVNSEMITSPLSCTKGNGSKVGRIPSQSGCSSKDCEILEFRPSKARKKLFALQLPADQYIDTEEGEQSRDDKTPDIAKYPPKRNDKITSESSLKLNFGGVTKIDCDGDASRFDSCLRNSVGLADLNEPIQVEEAAIPGSVDFKGGAICHTEIKDLDRATNSKSHFLLGLSKEVLQNSQRGSSNGMPSNQHIENRRVGREWLPYMHETGKGFSCACKAFVKLVFHFKSAFSNVIVLEGERLDSNNQICNKS